MGRRTAILILIPALVVSACTGSDVDEPIPAAGNGTTTNISTSSTDSEPVDPSTETSTTGPTTTST